MLIGYARVSTAEQNLDLQIDALTAVGCNRIFSDALSGAKNDRPGLEQALSHLRPGDTLVVWRLDRLGRSLKHLIDTVDGMNASGIGFKSLNESIDTSTSGGKLILGIFATLAEFERNLIRERTAAGLVAARARGKNGGRPQKHSDRAIAAVTQMAESTSIADVCRELGISRATYYRRLKINSKP